jgi:diketogulonate reductase-like aldo/keto reductase
VTACLDALKAGYRDIDTAQFYQNEKEVGEAIPGSSVSSTCEKVNKSVTLIDGKNGCVDLFLIHSASSGSNGRKMMWQALEKLVEEERAKSIGVSNFGVGHIEEMKKYAKIWPHVNQIEVGIPRTDHF